MPNEPKPWGSICLGSRLEKNVEADFVIALVGIVTNGLRKGDAVRLERGQMAHLAANSIIRAFLTDTECDSLMFLDSDADFEPDLLTRLREYKPGWDYDGLQVFHVRRNNPSEPIWFTRNGDEIVQNMILGEGVADVGLVGTHCAIFRREIFTRIYEEYGKGIEFDNFQWFCYPRHLRRSDEVTLSFEASDLGFRLGATTDIRVGHISKAPIGWTEYQEYLDKSMARERAKYYDKLTELVAEFTGVEKQQVQAKSIKQSSNARDGWIAINPKTAEEVRAFYGRQDNGYLYELVAWNWSELYWNIVKPLYQVKDKRVLVIGAGLGTEADILADNNRVDIFELPGVLLDFCKFRLDNRVRYIDNEIMVPGNGLHQYDLIVGIDVFEHVHPDEIDSFLEAVRWSMAPDCSLYLHNNFETGDNFPMHYDHAKKFFEWCRDNGIERIGEYEYCQSKVLETV